MITGFPTRRSPGSFTRKRSTNATPVSNLRTRKCGQCSARRPSGSGSGPSAFPLPTAPWTAARPAHRIRARAARKSVTWKTAKNRVSQCQYVGATRDSTWGRMGQNVKILTSVRATTADVRATASTSRAPSCAPVIQVTSRRAQGAWTLMSVF